ncbi:MAG: pyridoxine 5'-phosphate synthase [Hyphomicrobiaceae bacterium]|nr:pyridoxine 5'-phosphate synthase [Hyphomicrobiaceae bacterium]
MRSERPLRLGVNIDHVATLRNARGGAHPDPVRAAHLAIAAGADGITAHLREDRRHIRDSDIARLKAEITRPLNLEMAATEEMVRIALATLPNACCIVPERREERTTEGGLDVAGGGDRLSGMVAALKSAGIRVSLFIEPEASVIAAAGGIGADIVELHTGTYCEAVVAGDGAAIEREVLRHREAARIAAGAGLEVHAGHGLTYGSVGPIARIGEIVELNIGHFLVGEAVFDGLMGSVRHMRRLMDEAREPGGPARS